MKPVVLSFEPLPPFLAEPLASAYEFRHAVDRNDRAALAAAGQDVRGFVAKGETQLKREHLDLMPKLEIISVFGVGYDGIDVGAARERGIPITNTPDVLTDEVADLAIALMLDAGRGMSAADRYVRAGAWERGPFPLTRKVSGASLGIVGLGRIGKAIAKRAAAFDMTISYTARGPKPLEPYTYYPNPVELARAVDFLVVATFGGPTTRNLIDRAVLDALGPESFLINVARGSVVDEVELLAALREKRIAGAGLDVFADEPRVPSGFFGLDNVVLTPHMASATHETRQAMAQLALSNLNAYFAGQPLITPIPG